MLFNINIRRSESKLVRTISPTFGVGAAQADHGYTLKFERILELTIYCRRKTD